MCTTPTALLGSWVLHPIKDVLSLGTDFEMHAKWWQGSIEEPAAKDFCCEGGLHYQIEQSARNPLKREQVPRVLGALSRSCHQTSYNQPWFTSLEIPWGFLARAVLRWLSGGLCHARKCQFEDITWEEKGTIPDRPMDVFMRNLWQKAEQGKKTGTNCCTRFPRVSSSRKRIMCARNMGAHVQRGTWRTKGIKKRDEKLDSRAAEKGTKKLVSSNCAKILEKENSN